MVSFHAARGVCCLVRPQDGHELLGRRPWCCSCSAQVQEPKVQARGRQGARRRCCLWWWLDRWCQGGFHPLAILLEPVDWVHPDVAWSAASPSVAPSTATAAGPVGSAESAAVALAGAASTLDRCTGPGHHWPVGPLPPGVLPSHGWDTLLGSAVPHLHFKHYDAEPAVAKQRVVLRLRCYLSHGLSFRHSFTYFSHAVSYSYFYCCR